MHCSWQSCPNTAGKRHPYRHAILLMSATAGRRIKDGLLAPPSYHIKQAFLRFRGCLVMLGTAALLHETDFIPNFPSLGFLPSRSELSIFASPMDRIEQTEGANDDATNTHLLPGDSSTGRPTSQYLQSPAGSQRSRRPSIRIRRLSSTSSVSDTPNIQVNGDELHSPTRAEENWPSARRRSSSEPRPGRWSAPPEIVLSRLETGESQLRMTPLTEETSNLSSGAYPFPRASQHLAPPPPTAGSDNRNLLRRASIAALAGRFHRNRASTVGADPAAQAQRESQYPRTNEYDPRIVDFLDVVGT